jgi:hypothetical protein
VLMQRRRAAENTLRERLSESGELQGRYGRVLDELAALQAEKRAIARDYAAFTGLSTTSPYNSATLRRALATHLWLSGGKTEAQRQAIASVVSQPRALDQMLLEARIRRLLAATTGEVFRIEGSSAETPAAQAAYILATSVFADSARTAQAVGADAVPLSDPALLYVRSFIERLQRYQSANAGFTARQADLLADLGRARFGVFGYGEPPDATFSLRMADGVVKGYPYNGTLAPAFTTYHGLFDRYASFKLRRQGAGDWNLPTRWKNPPASFDRNAPINFVLTSDIIGGNSGSPVLSKNLEVVGLIFDGNIESLPSSFIYTTETARAVAVDVRGMYEALDDLYDLDRIARELRDGGLYATEAEADRVARPARPTRRTRTRN